MRAAPNIVELNRHVPHELRELAKAAYIARRRLKDAERANVAAMIAFTFAALGALVLFATSGHVELLEFRR